MSSNKLETVYFKGDPCHTCGLLPKVGDTAPNFTLTGQDLKNFNFDDIRKNRVVINVFPSLDTPVCAASVRRFNQEAASLPNTVIVCVSMDLPFASGRFCEANGIKDVVIGSAFRHPQFGADYGLTLVDGPLAGLLTRAVIILDQERKVLYCDLVSEITHEPDYEAALSVLKK